MAKKRKKNNLKNIILLILFIISFIYTLTTTEFEAKEAVLLSDDLTFEEKDIIDEFLKIYFFDVGQADCTLIINNHKTMLIDAGNNEDGKLLANYIKDLGIDTIDYLVGTHAHEDHIGGLDNIIDSFNIGTIYMPYTTEKTTTTKTFEDVLDSIIEKDLSITSVETGDKFTVGSANCEIMHVNNSEPTDANEQSICIRMEFGEESYLFMGDATENNEKTRTWPKTTVLKVGHHGSSTSTSKKFLEQVSPGISIISVGEDNSYNHPNKALLTRLENINTNIYRTDELGTILLISDGKSNMIKSIETNVNGN